MSEKDQAPTDKRLRDARKKGEIVFSTEVSSALVFLVVLAALGSQAPRVIDTLRALFGEIFAALSSRDPQAAISTVLALAIHGWLTLGLGIIALAGTAGLAVSLAQAGGLVAFSRIAPSFDRLNPAAGLKRMFSMKLVVGLLKTGVKTLILCVTLWVLLRGSLSAPLQAGYLRPDAILAVTGKLLLSLSGWAALIFVAFAALDYAYQQYEFLKQHRMSIDEVRREYREMEGDPHLNSRRRNMAHEMVFNSLQDRVKMASAVLHSANAAVALCYAGKGKVPWVAARGEGETARRIVEWAGEFLVPTVADGPLAETLYESAREYQYIESSLYKRVATVLRWAEGEEDTAA